MRKLILTAVCIAVSCSVTYATGARVGSLAGASSYLLDDSQVYAWPCRMPLFYRTLIAELGTDGQRISSNSSVAGIYADQEQTFGAIGLAANRATAAQQLLSDYLEHTYTVGTVSVEANIIERLNQRGLGAGLRELPVPQRGIELLYAKRFGDWTPGLRIERAAAENSQSITGQSATATSSATGLTLSAGYDPSDALKADLGLDLASFSFSSGLAIDATGARQTFESKGSLLVAFHGRAFYALNDEMNLVPRLAIEYGNLGYGYTQSDTLRAAEGKTTATGFTLGAGWQYAPAAKYTVVAGLEIAYRSVKTADSVIVTDPGDVKRTETSWDLPALHLGLEYQAAKWLIIRMGGSKRLSSVRTVIDFSDQTSLTTDASNDSYQLGMGAGFKMGNLLLDVMVNPELLYSGGNIVSGSKTWPVSQASVLYRF